MFASANGVELTGYIIAAAAVILAAAIPTWLGVRNKNQIKETSNKIGTPNGHGDLVQMLEAVLDAGKAAEAEARKAAARAEAAALSAQRGEVQMNSQALLMATHIQQDHETFREEREWREGPLKEWQDTVDIALSNIQNAQAPHTPTEEGRANGPVG